MTLEELKQKELLLRIDLGGNPIAVVETPSMSLKILPITNKQRLLELGYPIHWTGIIGEFFLEEGSPRSFGAIMAEDLVKNMSNPSVARHTLREIENALKGNPSEGIISSKEDAIRRAKESLLWIYDDAERNSWIRRLNDLFALDNK
jgi:hypothetical protein